MTAYPVVGELSAYESMQPTLTGYGNAHENDRASWHADARRLD